MNVERLCIVWLALGLFGCGGSDLGRPTLEDVVPVNGTVTYQGQPLENFQVTFRPTDGRKPGVAITDADGKFKLGTNKLDDGCPPGPCKVGVAFAPPGDDGLGEPIDDPSKLPKPKVKVPAKLANPDTSDITVDVPQKGLKDYALDLK
jgi:hypothetical protein